ncbi:serine/threonine protein kinase [Paenibacillus guangzhouensis]|uniref:serine/threonine protein kinase n=1 Tax=Paenibacillus guangzhouensis TaxID=1473112 RepID=UPI001266AA73|nr:serine/threonine protein kinase [Paenibacillus guangzhouensis]
MKWESRLSIHQVLGGRYRVMKQIGEGGMSYVYLVEDLKLVGKRWAVKETRLQQPGNAAGVAAEAAMLIRLNHPNLPQIVDFLGPDAEGYIYLFMDYIEGETLAVDFERRGRSLAFDHILRLGIQLCEVLQYLHQCQPPIVYRDLKPTNVMMDVHGQIRLIDFGIARHFKPNQEDDTVCLGTVGFAAPEQYTGKQSDTRSDLYGLGALLMHLITGGRTSQFGQAGMDAMPQEVPLAFRQLLKHLLDRDPNLRIQTAQEVREKLEQIHMEMAKTWRGNQPVSTTHRWRGTGTIALLGIDSGVGTTHTAIMFAHYLAASNQRVACVECMRTEAFYRIRSIFDGEPIRRSGEHFTIHGVDYYPYLESRSLIPLLHTDYDVIVLDLGVYGDNAAMFAEFLRANISCVVASGAEWRQEDLSDFMRRAGFAHQAASFIGLIPLATQQTIRDMEQNFIVPQLYAIPYHVDPFHIDDMARKALSAILPMEQTHSNWRTGLGKLLFSRRSRRDVKN